VAHFAHDRTRTAYLNVTDLFSDGSFTGLTRRRAEKWPRGPTRMSAANRPARERTRYREEGLAGYAGDRAFQANRDPHLD
jgi:hypothetical protein